MDYMEKLKKRLNHWMEHNNKHMEEYEKLAEELKSKGLDDVANYILNLIKHTEKMNEDLKKALEELN